MAFEREVEREVVSGDRSKGDEKVVFEKGNVTLVLRQSECFPSDPGSGDPAVVFMRIHDGKVVSDPMLAVECLGEIQEHKLSSSIMKWLLSKDDKTEYYLNEWYELAEKAGK